MYGAKKMNAKEVARAEKMVEKKELVRLRGCFKPTNYEEHVLRYQYAACGTAGQQIRLCFNCSLKYGGSRCKKYRIHGRKVNTFVCKPAYVSYGSFFGDYMYCEYVYEKREGARTLVRNHYKTGSRLHGTGATSAILKEERANGEK